MKHDQVNEIQAGEALIIKKSGRLIKETINNPTQKASCSFERIYFSRGSDYDIYKERKELGRRLFPKILKSISSNFENTVFSFIPNTAETSFYGLIEKAQEHILDESRKKILELNKLSEKNLKPLLSSRLRIEKVTIKDVKLRTFITEDTSRDDLVAHVYDITYGTV